MVYGACVRSTLRFSQGDLLFEIYRAAAESNEQSSGVSPGPIKTADIYILQDGWGEYEREWLTSLRASSSAVGLSRHT